MPFSPKKTYYLPDWCYGFFLIGILATKRSINREKQALFTEKIGGNRACQKKKRLYNIPFTGWAEMRIFLYL
jgi:hypothetical protein